MKKKIIVQDKGGDYSSTQHWMATGNNVSGPGENTLNQKGGEIEESGIEQQKWSKVQKYDL